MARKYIIVQCTYCKKELHRYKSQIKNNPKSFCSPKCLSYYNEPEQTKIMQKVNNNNFYYLIGLIVTDGNIQYPKQSTEEQIYKCRINLKPSDQELIINIKNMFGGYIHYCKQYIGWYINNKDLVDYLLTIGVTNRKTYELNVEKLNNWFISLTEIQKEYFIRGCFDGDGSINFINNRGNSNICSTSLDFLNIINNYFNTNYKIYERTKEKYNKYNYKIKATCSLFYYTLRDSQNMILNKIYNNINLKNDLYLVRKYNNYKIIESYYNYR